MKPAKLVIADFDGTLARIRKNPKKVVLSKKMHALLQKLLTRNVLVIVLSARPNSFLRRVLPPGIRGIGARGNKELFRFQKQTKKIRKAFLGIPIEFSGATIKKSPGGVDIHYRNAHRIREKELEKTVFRKAKAIGAQVRTGRKAFEVVPIGLHDKKKVVRNLAKNWKGPILFLGDDESDAQAAHELSKQKNAQCFLRRTTERKTNPKRIRQLSDLKETYRILSQFANQ